MTSHHICTRCNTQKPYTDFYEEQQRNGNKRRRKWCKDCTKANQTAERNAQYNKKRNKELIYRYGITLNTYQKMLIEQNGKCKICPKDTRDCRFGLVVDHCHTTGRVRGLLCDKCNQGLGAFRDSPEYLLKAVEYLNS